MNDLFGFQGCSDHIFSVFVGYFEHSGGHVGGQELVFSHGDFNWLNFEGFGAVLREGPNEGIEADHSFGSVQGCHFDQHIFCLYRNL